MLNIPGGLPRIQVTKELSGDSRIRLAHRKACPKSKFMPLINDRLSTRDMGTVHAYTLVTTPCHPYALLFFGLGFRNLGFRALNP